MTCDISDVQNIANDAIVLNCPKGGKVKKTVTSTGQYMLVHFQSDDVEVWHGFRAYFNQMPINSNCVDWLNTNDLSLTTPDNPSINCSWIITTSMGSIILINFHGFEVKKPYYLLRYIILILCYIYLQQEYGNSFLNIYDGGSTKDDLLTSIIGNYDSTQVNSTGSQLFIEFATNGNGVTKGFSASIKFGTF